MKIIKVPKSIEMELSSLFVVLNSLANNISLHKSKMIIAKNIDKGFRY